MGKHKCTGISFVGRSHFTYRARPRPKQYRAVETPRGSEGRLAQMFDKGVGVPLELSGKQQVSV